MAETEVLCLDWNREMGGGDGRTRFCGNRKGSNNIIEYRPKDQR